MACSKLSNERVFKIDQFWINVMKKINEDLINNSSFDKSSIQPKHNNIMINIIVEIRLKMAKGNLKFPALPEVAI